MRIASKKRMRVVKDEGKTEDAVQRKRATRGFTWWRQWRRSVARGESYYFILIAMNNAAECNVEGGGGDVDQRGAYVERGSGVGLCQWLCACASRQSRGSCQCQSELAAWQRVVSVIAYHFITPPHSVRSVHF